VQTVVGLESVALVLGRSILFEMFHY
jgi:hypothetical protein